MLTKNKGAVAKRGLGFEKAVGEDLTRRRIPYKYQPKAPISYVIEHEYTPDFRVGDMLIETKGFFLTDDRRKHVALKKAYPNLDIRFVFQNPSTPVEGASKRKCGTKLTNGEWATKNGFKFAKGTIPNEWLEEQGI